MAPPFRNTVSRQPLRVIDSAGAEISSSPPDIGRHLCWNGIVFICAALLVCWMVTTALRPSVGTARSPHSVHVPFGDRSPHGSGRPCVVRGDWPRPGAQDLARSCWVSRLRLLSLCDRGASRSHPAPVPGPRSGSGAERCALRNAPRDRRNRLHHAGRAGIALRSGACRGLTTHAGRSLRAISFLLVIGFPPPTDFAFRGRSRAVGVWIGYSLGLRVSRRSWCVALPQVNAAEFSAFAGLIVWTGHPSPAIATPW